MIFKIAFLKSLKHHGINPSHLLYMHLYITYIHIFNNYIGQDLELSLASLSIVLKVKLVLQYLERP